MNNMETVAEMIGGNCWTTENTTKINFEEWKEQEVRNWTRFKNWTRTRKRNEMPPEEWKKYLGCSFTLQWPPKNEEFAWQMYLCSLPESMAKLETLEDGKTQFVPNPKYRIYFKSKEKDIKKVFIEFNRLLSEEQWKNSPYGPMTNAVVRTKEKPKRCNSRQAAEREINRILQKLEKAFGYLTIIEGKNQ